MPIEVCTVGGFSEVGRNMTAVKIDNEVIILDMGIDVARYISYTEDEDLQNVTAADLIKEDIIPDITHIQDWKPLVKAIIPTHAHLDHVAAIPYLAENFNAPIFCTPFTARIIQATLKDNAKKLRNPIRELAPNGTYPLTKNISLEFIHMTHSTPQTVFVALHTKYGTIIYGNDFKFDNSPVLGKKPNYERLQSLGDEGVLLLIVDSLYSSREGKTPSEAVAKEMLRDVMLGTASTGKIFVVTTFASHLARLKSIVEFGKQMNRKIVFMGRSMAKYIQAGEDIKIVSFSKEGEILSYSSKVKRMLKQIDKEGRGKYLLVMTGHQGEKKAMLSKIARGEFDFAFKTGDIVCFSSNVIPSDVNKGQRAELERMLKHQGVRMFKDIHQSGHASHEDLRDLVHLIRPKHIIPAHGDVSKTVAMAELAKEEGYILGETVHLMHNGLRKKF
ncbi:RNase J family beta-CASP ribonuclease [Candidatus Woesearchaeota archaeon]|nr:RNase J family beta-CASP ribonuclease [Candidatus Woesearchaeota archaeon]